MSDQIIRIINKLSSKRIKLNPVLSESDVRAFELRHNIVLPIEYRNFITMIGNGGEGPVGYGIDRLGEVASDMGQDEVKIWSDLLYVKDVFPFTKYWVWDDGELTIEGTKEDLKKGSIYIGNDGCGMYWHLIITGPERGIPWQFCEEGIQPVCPRRNFLQWYEDWLDGLDSFYGFKSKQ